MMNRRTFTRLSAGLAFGALAVPKLSAMPEKKLKQIGVQLYTVRDAMDKDPVGTLQKIAKIGYKVVEAAGYSEGQFYGKSPKAFKTILNDLGLTLKSGHTQTGKMAPNSKRTLTGGEWEAAVADFKEAGQEYIALAWLDPRERKSLDDYKWVGELLNKSAEVCKKYDLQMAYHNHDFEFQELDGQLPMEVLLNGTDPELVKLELDIYWITKAGHDPLAFFNKHAGRIPLWHVKDIANTAERSFTEVGNGTIDWKKIFAAGKVSGMKHFFVEQDVSKDPFASLEKSYGYLSNLKV